MVSRSREDSCRTSGWYEHGGVALSENRKSSQIDDTESRCTIYWISARKKALWPREG